MKIPKSIKVGGHIIKIDITSELNNANGLSDYDNNTIKICKLLPKSQRESTLIHEIFHFLNSTWSCDKKNHELMDSLAEQFYQVLTDNKLLK